MKALCLTFLALTFWSVSQSCTCTGRADHSQGEMTIEWYNDHPFVFLGVVHRALTVTPQEQWVEVAVIKAFKGKLPDTVTIVPPNLGSHCAMDLQAEKGKAFLFYGYIDENGTLNSHYCHGSRPWYTRSVMKELPGQYHEVKQYEQEEAFIKTVSKVKEGPVSTFYSNGELQGKGQFKNGFAYGKWEYFTYQGQQKASGNYEKGVRQGAWQVYEYSTFTETDPKMKQHEVLRLQYVWRGNYTNGYRDGVWHKIYQDGFTEEVRFEVEEKVP